MDAGELAEVRRLAARFARERLAPAPLALETDLAAARALCADAERTGLAGAMAWGDGGPDLVAGGTILEELATACAGSAWLVLQQGLASCAARGAVEGPCAFGWDGPGLLWGGRLAKTAYWIDAGGTRLCRAAGGGDGAVDVIGLRAAAPAARAAGPATTLVEGDPARSVIARLRAVAEVGGAAIAAGLARGAVAAARAYAAERFQGGDLIAKLAVVRGLIGRAALGARQAALLWGAAARSGDARDAAAAYAGATAAAAAAVTDALQVLGGYGYMAEYGLEKRYRDAQALRLALGAPAPRALDAAEEVNP